MNDDGNQPAKLTDHQVFRTRLAAGHLDEARRIAWVEAAPAEAVMWLGRLTDDVDDLLQIIRDVTTGY